MYIDANCWLSPDGTPVAGLVIAFCPIPTVIIVSYCLNYRPASNVSAPGTGSLFSVQKQKIKTTTATSLSVNVPSFVTVGVDSSICFALLNVVLDRG